MKHNCYQDWFKALLTSLRYFWPASSYRYWLNTAVQLNSSRSWNLGSCSFITIVSKSPWQGHMRCVWDSRHLQCALDGEISWEIMWLNYIQNQRLAKEKLWSFDVKLICAMKSVNFSEWLLRLHECHLQWKQTGKYSKIRVFLCIDKLENTTPHTQSLFFYFMDLKL